MGYRKGIKDLMNLLEYTGPAELFTMYLCLLGDKAIQRTNVDFIAARETDFVRMLNEFFEDHGWDGNPAIMIKKFVDKAMKLKGK